MRATESEFGPGSVRLSEGVFGIVTMHAAATRAHLEIVALVHGAASASPGQGIGSSAAKRRRTFSVIRDTSLS